MIRFGILVLLCGAGLAVAAEPALPGGTVFPPALDSYGDANYASLWEVLRHRVQVAPFNLWATVIFLLAVVHTFFTHIFRHWAHVVEERHCARWRASREEMGPRGSAARREGPDGCPTCVSARVLHFLGEVEAVFGIWVVPLMVLLWVKVSPQAADYYVNKGVSYSEPLFVVVIMVIAATRPVLRLAEQCLQVVARLGGGRPLAWWLAILTLGPLLGSFITEPGAMTISASLLGRRFYDLKPRLGFAYATLGLLFVNISVGGVLTHFAAPPVLMVARPWGWDTKFMASQFGWIAAVGIVCATGVYALLFRKEFARLAGTGPDETRGVPVERPIPAWVTLGHLLAMAWSVWQAHHPVLLVGGFLFFLAFYDVTRDYQSPLRTRTAMLVGFFLAGLVIHGGLQAWWIGPLLRRLGELPLLFGAIGLTAFNDNAAITYLASLAPDLTMGVKYSVVAGAIIGGGLTVIANAPNPAGQALLGRYFPDGVSPLRLLLGALLPTAIMTALFILL